MSTIYPVHAHRSLVEKIMSVAPDASLCWGSLLGCVREGGPIPGDGDVDMYVTFEPDSLFLGDLRDAGLNVLAIEAWGPEHAAFIDPSLQGLPCKYRLQCPDSMLRADLYVLWPLRDGRVGHGNKHAVVSFPEELVLPTRPATFDGFTVNIPVRAEENLCYGYGPDWRTPKPDYVFSVEHYQNRKRWRLEISEPTGALKKYSDRAGERKINSTPGGPVLTSIRALRPLEKVFPRHLDNLASMIHSSGVLDKPLIVDASNGIILDGSHRYAYLLREGYNLAPVVRVNYASQDVRVGTHLKHRFLVDDNGTGLTKEDCIKHAMTGKLLAPRTTRHFFAFRKLDQPTMLSRLEPGPKRDISHLLGSGDEAAHTEAFLREIDEDEQCTLDYLEEIRNSRRYLREQLRAMRRTIFFPGKFQPFHHGHLLTVSQLAKLGRVIVAITGDEVQDGWPRAEIAAAIRTLPGVEVVELEGRLVDRPNANGLPGFDVLATGNPEVIEWAEKHGVNVMKVERSGTVSGRMIRGTS